MAGTRGGGGSSARGKSKNDASLCAALVAYGEYHHNPWNQLIHLVCVPVLLFSLLVGLAYVPLALPPGGLAADVANAASAAAAKAAPWLADDLSAGLAARPLPLLAVLAYSLYYTLALDPFAGLCWTLGLGAPLWLGAVHLWRVLPLSAWRWAVGVHALSWLLQIVPGHAMLEGRRPALVDSFWQAIATAPLFVFVEVLFAANWNPGLRARVRRGVEAALREHHRNKGAGGGGAKKVR